MGKNDSKNNVQFKSSKGKRKTIKLRNGESIMDGNSVQMPFLAPYKICKNEKDELEPLTYVEYQWTTIENGKKIIRGLNVNGHNKLGVPTLRDKEVLRALQDIYIWDKVKNGVLYLETDTSKIKEEDLIIEFKSIDKIATAMGYKKISTQQKKSIKDSIERLVATTIFSTHSGGIYDAISKSYITDSTQSFRYLDEMKSVTTYDCENCLYNNVCKGNTEKCINEENKRKDEAKIKMSMFLYLNIAHNYRLYYIKDNTNKIKNLIARNIYMISRKWIGDGYISKANIQKYIDRIPMNAKAEKHRKQAIKEGVQKLNDYDFVEASCENDIITVIHKDKMPTSYDKLAIDKTPTQDTMYYKDKYNKYSEFHNALIDIGFTEEEMDIYIDLNAKTVEYFKALLRYVILQKVYNSKIDTKQYIINCIKSNKEIDEKYYNKQQ